MGLDMYAYVASKAGQQNEYYEGGAYDKQSGNVINNNVTQPREIAYWRKHPNLHGWMERLYRSKGGNSSFNGHEVELTWDDLEELERAIIHKQLPATSGFFFGNDSDDIYYKDDLAFVKNAKAEIFLGLKVFYNSSW